MSSIRFNETYAHGYNIMMRSYEKIILLCLVVISSLFPAGHTDAELVERVVAVVNDNVILLSEFKAAMRHAEESGKEVTAKDVIDRMIDNHLLLEQAKKFSFRRNAGDAAPSTPDKVIKNYIDKRIKVLIYIPFRDIEAYYYNNLDKYSDRDFYDVKSVIEEYLLNRTLEIRIQEHIDELREDARIRIQLD